MAANNYFGFTHGGTQYSTTAAAAAAAAATYQPGQPGYAVGHAAQSYTATPRPGQATAYDGFQTTHTSTPAYTYNSRQQEPAPPPPPSTNPSYEYGYARTTNTAYDGTKAYYPQPTQPAYSTTETHYQNTSKPAYTANTSFATPARPAANTKTPASTSAYGYSTATGTPSFTSNYGATATTTASYTGYDAALYSAATIYVQQQQQATTTNTNKNAAGWTSYKKGNMKQNKPKQPPKPQQLHYCDVCKISCAGPQTYREHLEGQKHKKKEAAAKAGAAAQTARGGNSLRCELCDVTCTGADAYAAHIRGAKHQKVVKLHTKLGKPIPSTEPVVVATNSSPTTPTSAVSPGVDKELKADEGKDDMKLDTSKLEDKPDIQPVGQDYIEEIKNEEGKVISFQCKLCECRFNDPNAKEMHMKGRRHRLQYKKKVNPELVVDIKPSLRQRKLQEEKLRRQQMKEEFWRRREEERWREEMSLCISSRMMEEEERLYWEERRRYEEEMEYYEWYRRYGRDPRAMPPPPRPFPAQPPTGPPMPMRRPDTSDDRHVIAKHALIYPKEEELQAVQKIITNTEKALKLVSDYLADVDAPKKEPEIKMEVPEATPNNKDNSEKKEEALMPPRTLKGVMRVGVLAKGLLLHGDLNVQLAVMCSEKPTVELLGRVADNLPVQLATVTDEKYEIKRCIEEASIMVLAATEPKTSVTITLTSPVMRETASAAEGGENVNVKDPPDVLDRQKCLDALAALRHAKWFQARANGLQSCVMVIRILRDLCQRVPTWAPLNSWAMELLVEKVISSAGQPLSPGDALRRVLEAIASGVLLPVISGGPGLMDPCEKDPADAAVSLSNQEREDITASAQHALRLLAFRQIHKVLGMDPLPPPKFTRGRFNRKRRRDNSAGEGPEEVADGKKDKKDENDKPESTMEVQEEASKA